MEFDSKKFKELLYPIVESYDSFCRKNNLRYTIYAGTLLGAIRHGGMIPWDDDIDVLMPRPDYNRFIQLAKDKFNPKYRIVNAYTDPHCYTTFTKIVDNNTTLVEYELMKDAVLGAYIDVFPLDGVDLDEIEAQKHYREYRAFQSKTRFVRSNYTLQLVLNKSVTFEAFFKNRIFKLFFPNYNRMLVKCDQLMSSVNYESANLTRVYCSPNHSHKVFCKEWFEDYIDIQFDHLTLRSIKSWDIFLKTLFKDYMKLPPEDKRITHHYHYFSDLNHGYNYEQLKTNSLI